MHREIELDVADGSWHHLCVTWERKNRLLSVYKNGQRKYLSNEYEAGARNRGIEGTLLLLKWYTIYSLYSMTSTTQLSTMVTFWCSRGYVHSSLLFYCFKLHMTYLSHFLRFNCIVHLQLLSLGFPWVKFFGVFLPQRLIPPECAPSFCSIFPWIGWILSINWRILH